MFGTNYAVMVDLKAVWHLPVYMQAEQLAANLRANLPDALIWIVKDDGRELQQRDYVSTATQPVLKGPPKVSS